MRPILLGLGGFLAAGGIVYAITGTPEYAEARIEREARQAVERGLRDPSSAQFDGLYMVEGDTVCGYVNAKNGFGGYVGRRLFVYRNGKAEVINSDDIFALTNNPLAHACMPGLPNFPPPTPLRGRGPISSAPSTGATPRPMPTVSGNRPWSPPTVNLVPSK